MTAAVADPEAVDTPKAPKPGGKPATPGGAPTASTPKESAEPTAPGGVPLWAVAAPALIAAAMWIGWQFGPAVALIVGIIGLIILLLWRLAKRRANAPQVKGKPQGKAQKNSTT